MSKRTSKIVDLGRCPSCDADLSDVSTDDYGDEEPKQGDLALCYQCGEYLMVDNGRMRAVSIQEMNTLGLGLSTVIIMVQVHNEIVTRNRARAARLN